MGWSIKVSEEYLTTNTSKLLRESCCCCMISTKKSSGVIKLLYLTGKGDLQPLTQPNKPVLNKCSTFQRKVDN